MSGHNPPERTVLDIDVSLRKRQGTSTLTVI